MLDLIQNKQKEKEKKRKKKRERERERSSSGSISKTKIRDQWTFNCIYFVYKLSPWNSNYSSLEASQELNKLLLPIHGLFSSKSGSSRWDMHWSRFGLKKLSNIIHTDPYQDPDLNLNIFRVQPFPCRLETPDIQIIRYPLTSLGGFHPSTHPLRIHEVSLNQ